MLVVAEVVHVLTSSRTGYGLARQAVADPLEPLIMMPGLEIEHKGVFSRVFDLFRVHNIDLWTATTRRLRSTVRSQRS